MFSAKKVISSVLLVVISLTFTVPPQYAQAQFVLTPSIPAPTSYVPVIIKGVNLNPQNPLKFDFIIDRGTSSADLPLANQSAEAAFRSESQKLIRYFLASLTIPQKDMWVNLSPNEPDRIVPQTFGNTEMGRDLLAQDFMLKQLTASLMSPDGEVGRKFWDKVYAKIYETPSPLRGEGRVRGLEIPTDIFNKVWIVPSKAKIYEHEKGAFITDTAFKVMTERDYVAQTQDTGHKSQEGQDAVTLQIVKDVIIPAIEQEVNHGKTFANLRQIYNSLILAMWYKEKVKKSVLGQAYSNKEKTSGLEVASNEKQKIYQQYLDAFRKGASNAIKEEYDPNTQQIVARKYFSGGIQADQAQISLATKEEMDAAMKAAIATENVATVIQFAGAKAPDAAMTSEIVKEIVKSFVEDFKRKRLPGGFNFSVDAQQSGEDVIVTIEQTTRSLPPILIQDFYHYVSWLTNKFTSPIKLTPMDSLSAYMRKFKISDAAMMSVEKYNRVIKDAEQAWGGELERADQLVEFLKNRFNPEKALESGAIFIPRAVVQNEARMGLTPIGIKLLKSLGIKNEIYVEAAAGINRQSGKVYFTDAYYINAGAKILSHDEFYKRAEQADKKVVVSIKEPQESEYKLLKNALLFTYLHLADSPKLTQDLLNLLATGVAYETIAFKTPEGITRTPVLAPASIAAGWVSAARTAAFFGGIINDERQRIFAESLQYYATSENFPLNLRKSLEGITVTVLGGGVAGESAAITLAKMGAKVYITEVNPKRILELEKIITSQGLGLAITVLKRDLSVPRVFDQFRTELLESSAIIGAVLIPGAKAPKEIDESTYEALVKGGKFKFFADIAIDQGGNNVRSVARKYQDGWPMDENRVGQFTVTNMPSVVPLQVSFGLERAKLAYLVALLMGTPEAVKAFPELEQGVNIRNGQITNKPVGEAVRMDAVSLKEADEAIATVDAAMTVDPFNLTTKNVAEWDNIQRAITDDVISNRVIPLIKGSYLKGVEKNQLINTIQKLREISSVDFEKSKKDNPLHHSFIVLDIVLQIAFGKKLFYPEIKKLAALAILHDLGYGALEESKGRISSGKIKQMIKDYELQKDSLSKELREEKVAAIKKAIQGAIDARNEHMEKGVFIAQILLEKFNKEDSDPDDKFSPEDIKEICALVGMHDNPGIAKTYETEEYKPYISGSADKLLIGKDKQLALIFREADRLWMLSYEGLIKDLMDSLLKGDNPLSVEKQLVNNIAVFSDERKSYDATGKDYGNFKGDTFIRTDTGYKIYKDFIQAWQKIIKDHAALVKAFKIQRFDFNRATDTAMTAFEEKRQTFRDNLLAIVQKGCQPSGLSILRKQITEFIILEQDSPYLSRFLYNFLNDLVELHQSLNADKADALYSLFHNLNDWVAGIKTSNGAILIDYWVETENGKMKLEKNKSWIYSRDIVIRDTIFLILLRNLLINMPMTADFKETSAGKIPDMKSVLEVDKNFKMQLNLLKGINPQKLSSLKKNFAGAISSIKAWSEVSEVWDNVEGVVSIVSSPCQESAKQLNDFYASIPDKAMTVDEENKTDGGIDLNAAQFSVGVDKQGKGFEYNVDPAMLQQFINAPGVNAIITNIQPITNLPVFLGLAVGKPRKIAYAITGSEKTDQVALQLSLLDVMDSLTIRFGYDTFILKNKEVDCQQFWS
ncbi:MAG: FAD-dependent oxidoreductase [Candidatus Omnitrophica bacterium]|nr:FAD-dependent oxidoreductase [Candidatus Omnitrophota bacterium]